MSVVVEQLELYTTTIRSYYTMNHNIPHPLAQQRVGQSGCAYEAIPSRHINTVEGQHSSP